VKYDNQGILLLFAHNYIETFDSEGKLISRQFCEEECILYAGDIKGEMVASGTVFQAILIWKISSPEVLMRLEGH
jgi:hypothetical protein